MKHDPAFEEFVSRLARMLFMGEVTPRDIYDTMMEVNDNDHDIAMGIKERAMEEAASMRSTMLSVVH